VKSFTKRTTRVAAVHAWSMICAVFGTSPLRTGKNPLYNSHSHKTPQSVLATHSGNVIQTAERNPIMNPQKTNLECLQSQKDCFQDVPFRMLQQSSRVRESSALTTSFRKRVAFMSSVLVVRKSS
jgi:hypothetical protein